MEKGRSRDDIKQKKEEEQNKLNEEALKKLNEVSINFKTIKVQKE